MVTHLELDLVSLIEQPEWKQMLFDIVKKEKMDPWNIDIAFLAAKFLERINEMKKLDFRIPANAVLASSILLRFKSDSWKITEEKEEYPLVFIPDYLIEEPTIPELEPVTRITKRQVTLEELIKAVEDAMEKEKKKKTIKRIEKEPLPKTIINLVASKEDDFEKLVNEVLEKVKEKADSQKMVLFSQLLEKKDVDEVIKHLIPLLHLAHKEKIHMWQEKIFGEIFIRLIGEDNAG